MKTVFFIAAIAAMGIALLSSRADAGEKRSGVIPSPDRLAEYIVGKWRYGIFRVEFSPIDSFGMGRISAAGRWGTYIPTRCGPGEGGNLVLRDDAEEVCVTVRFVDGIQVLHFPPRGSSGAKDVQLYPVQ